MAIKEVRREWDECQLDYVKEFILHKEADVAALPECCVGSTAIVGETGNVYVSGKGKAWKKREEAMEEGPGTGGGGEYTPPDWGSKHEEGYLMPETTLALDPDAGFAALISVIGVIVGEQYTVNWNGTDFVCIAAKVDVQGMLVICLGNYGALTGGESTNEPFCIMFLTQEQANNMGAGMMVMPLDGSVTPVVSIYGGTEIVQKIDKKFMPSPVFPTIDLRKYGLTEVLTVGPDEVLQLTEEQMQEVENAFEIGAFWCVTAGIEGANENTGTKALLTVGKQGAGTSWMATALLEFAGSYNTYLALRHSEGANDVCVRIEKTV